MDRHLAFLVVRRTVLALVVAAVAFAFVNWVMDFHWVFAVLFAVLVFMLTFAQGLQPAGHDPSSHRFESSSSGSSSSFGDSDSSSD